jgi:hypothetical protein
VGENVVKWGGVLRPSASNLGNSTRGDDLAIAMHATAGL